jgi:hypothetical protein
MFIIYLYYNACMYGGGLKEMPCFRTHIKLVHHTQSLFCMIIFMVHLWVALCVCIDDVASFLSVARASDRSLETREQWRYDMLFAETSGQSVCSFLSPD